MSNNAAHAIYTRALFLGHVGKIKVEWSAEVLLRRDCSRVRFYPETLSAGDEELLTKRAGECVLPGACPAPCTCNGATVDCSNKRLTSIPKDLPLYTSTL